MHPLPTSHFDQYLKRLDFSSLSEDAKRVVDFALPGFSGIEANHWLDDYLPTRLQEVARLVRGSGNRRRYAPGVFLPRGRYYSLTKDCQTGDDGGTMRAELNAYRAPELSGHVHIIDFTNQSDLRSLSFVKIDTDGEPTTIGFAGSPFSALLDTLVILLYDPSKFRSFVGTEVFQRMQTQYEGNVSSFFFDTHDSFRPIIMKTPQREGSEPFLSLMIKWDVPRVSFEKVVDLRRQETQQWFVGEFAGGRLTHFEELLPLLMTPKIGGGYLTTKFGIWAMRQNVDAIIYPSARNDVSVLWKDDEVLVDDGWCLIDLRVGDKVSDAEVTQGLQELMEQPLLDEWLASEVPVEMPYNQMFQQEVSILKNTWGGFFVRGVTKLNDLIYMQELKRMVVSTNANREDVSFEQHIYQYMMRSVRYHEQKQQDEIEASLLLADNACKRRVSGLVCDICSGLLDGHPAFAVHGLLIAEIGYLSESTRLAAAEANISVEKAHTKLMERARNDPTPWLLCETCVEFHLGTPEEKHHASEVHQRYLQGETIKLDDLPTASSLTNHTKSPTTYRKRDISKELLGLNDALETRFTDERVELHFLSSDVEEDLKNLRKSRGEDGQ